MMKAIYNAVRRYKIAIVLGCCILFYIRWLNHMIDLANDIKKELEMSPVMQQDEGDINKIAAQDKPSLLYGDNRVKNAKDAQRYHIAHIFSSFETTSPNQTVWSDMVQSSWIEAANKAYQKHGVKVEFIDASLVDNHETNYFARYVRLKESINDVMKGTVGTVGEIWKTAALNTTADVIVITNNDIGVTPQFYEHIWKNIYYYKSPNELKDDTESYVDELLEIKRRVDNNIEAANSVLRYIQICTRTKTSSLPLDHHNAICAFDARHLFELLGGDVELYKIYLDEDFSISGKKEVALNMHLLSAKVSSFSKALEYVYNLAKKDREVSNNKEIQNPNTILLDLPENQLENAEETMSPKELGFVQVVQKHFKIESLELYLITRVDVPVVVRKNLTFEEIYSTLKEDGYEHPGNDCFITRRKIIPHSVQHFGHPQGVRPFGYWIPSEFRRRGISIRRIYGTPDNPLTFHIGIGAWGWDAASSWTERADMQPRYTLFLVSNWYKVTDGGFANELLRYRHHCRDFRYWRDKEYCLRISGVYCRGVTRLACLYAQSMNIDDFKWYISRCRALKNLSIKQYNTTPSPMIEPFCGFCNFLLTFNQVEADSSSSPFLCIKGIPKECKNQKCIYLDYDIGQTNDKIKRAEDILDQL